MTDTEPATAAPAGAPTDAIALYGPEFTRDPGRLYRTMRRDRGPVVPILLEGDVPAWFVIGYREVHHVLSNPQLFARDSRRWNQWPNVPEDWPLRAWVAYQPSMLFTEGAEHRRRAGAISDALVEVDQFELRQRCERIADGLIDGFAGQGSAELIADYAHPIPLLALAGVFDYPEDQTPQLLRDMITLVDGTGDVLAAQTRCVTGMRELVARKRERPGPDVPSRLLAHPAGLTDDEVVQDLILVMNAAQRPTADWIGNTVRLMLTDERFALSLSGGRRSVSEALNEVLWEDTPTQNYIGRWAAQATRLGGRHIQAGDLLVLGFAAANTDPQVRPDPHAGPGGNHAQMSFSHGEHRCTYPGPELAQVIAKAAVEVLLDRLPDVILGVPVADLEWSPSVWMRGLTTLPVEFTPTYPHGAG
jgi:cytochrome P450